MNKNTIFQSKPFKEINLNKKEDFKTDEDGPLYYNLTLNKGFTNSDNTGFNTTANFSEINTQPILFNSGDWYIGLMRTTIPSGIIPRYIFPIQLGLINAQTGQPILDPSGNQVLNNNINLAYNTFTFRYYASNGSQVILPLNKCQQTCIFNSEILNPYDQGQNPYYSLPKSPAQNNGQQDATGAYYFVYNVITLLEMFNTTLKSLWFTFVDALNNLGHVLPIDGYPFFTYDEKSLLWSLNLRNDLFNQLGNYPRVELYSDDLTAENTFVPFYFNAQPETAWDITLYKAFETGNNIYTALDTSGNTVEFLKMTADQSSVVGYSAFQKVVFEISGDLSLINNEFDAIPLQFQQQTQSLYQKPYISMLTDIEVIRDQFAVNSTFIQFQASSIEQVRLLSLSKKSSVQNFNLSISWVDSYGNKRPLEIPSIGNPLTVKLAFFRKDFKKFIN